MCPTAVSDSAAVGTPMPVLKPGSALLLGELEDFMVWLRRTEITRPPKGVGDDVAGAAGHRSCAVRDKPRQR